MKRILIALAVLLSVQVAVAQVKPEAKAVEAAKSAAADAKKATKTATWLKLAKAYMDAYNAPAANVWVGGSQQEIQLTMGTQKPKSTENVELSGESYIKEVYEDKNLYYNQAKVLQMVEVTKPVCKDALDGALEAFSKAYELDTKGAKVKDITEGIKNIAAKYLEEGMNQYVFGNIEQASTLFEKSALANGRKPVSVVDSSAYYNAAFTAWMAGNNDRALSLFTKCKEIGYYFENGEVYAKLADIYGKTGQKDKVKETLEEGFSKFPQSQSILIGLINFYIEGGQDTDRLFTLLDEAKKNEPGNASLYYVEGNIHKQLGQTEEAVAAYKKASEIKPDYEFGFIGCGILYYEQAIKISEQAATEFDDAKYTKLVEDFEASLMNAIEPFESAYAICKDNNVKVSIAEYLKNIYYRFQDKDAKYKTGYEKYNEVVKTQVAN